MIEFCILGSGMAGSTIANLLSKKSSVEIFDKARGAGGRSSNRRFKNGASFDHGLQYIYPKNKLFKRFLINLERKKIIKKWEGNHLDLTLRVKRPGYKYIGKKGNSDIQKYLVKNISTNYKSSIDKIIYKKDHWVILVNDKFYKCRNLILTCPYPQMLTLARKYLKKNLLKEKIVMQPNITAMIAIKKDYNIPVSSIRFKNKILGWATNENSKNRFKTKFNLWTIQSNETFAKKIIKKYKKRKKFYLQVITKEFLNILGLKNSDIFFKELHGWKYSHNNEPIKPNSYWDKKLRLGICGDWFNGPRVEDAWISAQDLYKKIKK